MTENGVDPDDAENAGPQDHEDCRDHGFAEPARGGDGAVHKHGNHVGNAHYLKAISSRFDHGVGRSEYAEENAIEFRQPEPEKCSEGERIQQADKIAVQDFLFVSLPETLPDKAGTCHVKGCENVIDQRVGVLSGYDPFHRDVIEGIHRLLDEQIGDCENDVL